ncbi:MAG TPA: SRPBCC family protein [Gemmatimonadales bacterium]|nr:SRPBCC family protein [Gemmatimonadales bacterium]
MRTVDRLRIAAPPAVVFRHAADVERWPALLPHYRWVRVLEPGEPALVEMAAWRPFGPLRWPTWWASEMWVDPARHEVRYHHVRGVTTGMEVWWRVTEAPGGSLAEVIHQWAGPRWPLVRRPAAEWVIGPVFIHGIASRTLAGIGRAAEATAVQSRGPGPAQVRE